MAGPEEQLFNWNQASEGDKVQKIKIQPPTFSSQKSEGLRDLFLLVPNLPPIQTLTIIRLSTWSFLGRPVPVSILECGNIWHDVVPVTHLSSGKGRL